ncbi:alpha-glucan family phosphorylase [Natronoflexus pectinivorans]|uniref:Phosphorylase/glycogen(Starch) synthase n=1 Tax=Natronoflexus pectinivorans TaxID=682526 RepID=A0A4V2RWE3_9BACT|nr:alpha-glucan family phosphorylase [Natronoflexus pectinivorans]TCO07954.1 phosphorylase/glycogen(starch) synthase [Natronoflexus pectinivorans]
MVDSYLKPDYLFETSWEVCNKMGGIHTVLASKASTLVQQFHDKLIFIGPDVWRSPHKNPEFIPEEKMFADWQNVLQYEGLRVKVGRWNVPGKPLVILVDFTQFVSKKNEILSYLWETYKVDSISGQWDYIEPALFGYASGLVIESFYKFHLTVADKVVAHYNEWMTGSGALYLKDKMPQIGTIFTTHSTTLGRSLASNGFPLYDNMDQYEPDVKARELGVMAKHSLEKNAATHVDCFTTVSDITANECAHFLKRGVDVVTPNGFENNFVPQGDQYTEKRESAREKLRTVASAVLGYQVNKSALLVASSGRYEFRNKGADIMLDGLKLINENPQQKQEIIFFVLIPANTYGPRKDLIDRLSGKKYESALPNPFLTHGLNDLGYDPIINKIQEIHLNNHKEEKVKLIFVPSYLNGDDGIFNIPYYDLLIGMDLTVFPSYYEPWGYTPLESIAFGIPTITTTLAGFGIWAKEFSKSIKDGIEVIERTDVNNKDAISKIASVITSFSQLTEHDHQIIRESSFKLAANLEWNNLIKHYFQAYDIALKEVNNRKDSFAVVHDEPKVRAIPDTISTPSWKKLIVKSRLPDRLAVLHDLTRNMWWTWNYQAVELFEMIDEDLWEEVRKNPVLLLEKVSFKRLTELADDQQFTDKLDAVHHLFRTYMDKPMRDGASIAYFSMEYGLNDVLKIYSGGLGILAGDYLKEASDKGIDIKAIGLLYRFGYFKQSLTMNGEQVANYDIQEFSNLPIEEVRYPNGEQVHIKVDMPGREVVAAVWKAQIGRIPLYLMDTDIPANNMQDREITHMLYGGDWENRLKQEILLGIGGIRLLEEIDEKIDLYHCNEGHAALINVERLIDLVEKKFSFAEAMELVKVSSLFTTHTPVPAGHDKFDEDMFRVYMRHIPEKLNISWADFMEMGREFNNPDEMFSMSVLAAKTSHEVNGVSWLHGEVTKKMFRHLWKGYFPEELHINYVTNGVHYGTWTASAFRKLYESKFGEDFLEDVSDKSKWEEIYKIPDEDIWEVRKELRKKLIDYIRWRMGTGMIERHEDPSHIVDVLDIIREDALTIGFARRFATYKRAHLLFKDLDRLRRIVNNPDKPVQFIFAGKAHPADGAGQGLIKSIVDISKRPEFVGKIIFLENYDMDLGKRLISGVDVWLNTPTRPLEASGTSGQKAELNGVLNFSVLDGWWYEGYKEGAGWALTDKQTFDNNDYQDELDATTIYSIFENEVIPLFFNKNEKGIPTGWIKYIKNSIAKIAPEFTTRRMINDYGTRFYEPMFERIKKMNENDHRQARELAAWKRRVYAGWEYVQVLSCNMPDIAKQELGIGDNYKVDVVVDLKRLAGVDIGLEIVIADPSKDEHNPSIVHIEPFKIVKKEGSIVHFSLDYKLNLPGVYKFGLRLFPFNGALPHKQDFALIKWI